MGDRRRQPVHGVRQHRGGGGADLSARAPVISFPLATSPHAMSDVSACCCADWVAGLARDHAGKLAAIARREGVGAIDALDVVQDAFHTLLQRPEADALRDRPDEAARLLAVIVKNAAR